MDSLPSNRLIVGCGYVGSQVAKMWLAAGDQVYAVTRSMERASRLSNMGITPIIWNWYRSSNDTFNEESFPSFDSVLITASHAPVENIPPAETHTRGLTHLCNRLQSQFGSLPNKWVYVSTTGVYAHREDGAWVDEESAIAPSRPGSVAAANAELWLRSNLAKNSLTILRAAGIYGPDRVPRLDSLKQNEVLEANPDSYLNLIHREDLSGIIATVSKATTANTTYNVADGSPVLRSTYYEFIAKQIGSLPPRFAVADKVVPESFHTTGQTLIRRRGEGSKRISTIRLRTDLNYVFQYPDYQAGLKRLLTNV